MNQAQLLEQYIETLRTDPDALPPLALDPDTAHFARTLVTMSQRDLPDTSAKDRVWNQILFTMHLTSENDDLPDFVFAEPVIDLPEQPEIIQLPFLQRYAWAQGLATAAAAVFVVVVFSAVLIYSALPALVHSSIDYPETSYVVRRNVQLDPGDSLLLRTVSMFHEPELTGEGYRDVTIRPTIAD